jgi:DNA-binding GntR family transcriptional regulator
MAELLQLKRDWTIVQDAPVGPQLYRILRERIIRNDLEPGVRISEAETAADFSVSRQPIREAFIKLAEEGLLEIRPQRGTIVRKISIEAVKDARFVREAIEAEIVRLLAEAADPALARELRRQLAQQKKAAGRDSLLFMQLDELFHRTLAQAAGKSYAWSVVESVKAQMDRVRYLSVQRFPKNALVRQHTAIANAIAEGDASAAENAMRVHLRAILTDLPEVYRAKPEFFEGAGG